LGVPSPLREFAVKIVTIDGPAGVGKSTVARRVAERLGYAYLDTGAMYRAATWWALSRGVDLDNASALTESTRCMPLEIHSKENPQRIVVDGQDVTDAIRTPEVTRKISKLDYLPAVREHLGRLQQEAAARGPTVAEGRDMGTVVFPEAFCKVYLVASLEERTQRRGRDLEAQGVEVNLASLREEIHDRDQRDRTRQVAPLKRADDALLIDTSDMTLDEVVEAIVQHARECA